MKTISTLPLLLLTAATTEAFAPLVSTSTLAASASRTQLHLGIPSFLTPKNDKDNDDNKKYDDTSAPEKKIGLSGVLQLITAGAGAPFLGEFQGVDKETGKFMFSLEANNLVDEDGNSKQTQAKYFENGWVDENEPEFKWPWQKKSE